MSADDDQLPPVPDPPWRTARRGEPRVPISRDAIVNAAVRVLDRVGLDALSMRRVAEEMGTGAGSLYWHVRNKEELLQLLSERLSMEVKLPPPDPSRWQEQIKQVCREMRDGFHRHRDAARLSMGRVPAGPMLASYAEWMFELLTPLGIPDHVIAYLGDIGTLFVGAYAFEESLGVASPTGAEMAPGEMEAMFRDYLLSLPSDRFPHVHRAADQLFGGDADDRFEFGIDLVVRGLSTFVDPD
jgi:AcrR family transcriptional regulator